MIRTLIVDDEPLARRGLRLRLEEHGDVEVVGEAPDGPAAVQAICELLPDLLFLDVQMPGMSGFEVLGRIAGTHLPAIVFVTAYDQYAIQAFDVRALDYLLKPFTKERFDDALARARRELALREDEGGAPSTSKLLDLIDPQPEAYLTRLAVKSRDRFLLVKADEIDWVEAAGNYVAVHARGREYLLRSTVASLERRLDPQRFTRIHRSAIVNVDRVAEIRSDAHGDYDVTLTTGKVLRMSRNFSKRLLGRG